MHIDQETPATMNVQALRAALAKRLLGAAAQCQAHPLSSAQQRLWFIDQLEPNSPLYNIPCVARLRGTLDLDALQRALDAMVQRHEALRTRFVSQDGEPAQVVDAPFAMPIERTDLTQAPAAQKEGIINQLIQEAVKRPFHLGIDRLIRVTLLHLDTNDHVLIINMHHIISDEWSFRIFLGELTRLYAGFLNQTPVELPELPIQYKDYAAWQQQWLQGPRFREHVQFWSSRLQGHPAPVELPTDYPRPAKPTFRGSVQTHFLGPELTQGLKHLAQAEGVTLYMVLLAAFKALLFRYSRQEDIIVGSPMAGRNRMETEGLIGLFVNTLPLRTRASDEMRFRELLAAVREVALACYCHQDMPFDKLVEVLQPERSATHATPFISVMFLTQTEMEEVTLPGIQLEFLDVVTDTSKFDLLLGVQDLGAQLVAGVEYNTDLFRPSTITRFLQHYESLLQGIVAQPNQRLSELPLLSEGERHQLVGKGQPPIPSTRQGERVDSSLGLSSPGIGPNTGRAGEGLPAGTSI